MFIKKFPQYLTFITALLLSTNIFAVDNSDVMSNSMVSPSSTYGGSVSNTTNQTTATDPLSAGSTSTTSTTNNTNSTMNMNAASDGVDTNLKTPTDTGIFTVASGQKCIPSCEGTYVINGQNYPALLFLNDARTAFLISPYHSKDSLNFKQLTSQKNTLKGSWKPRDNGSIEFRATAATASTTTTKYRGKRWSSNNSNKYSRSSSASSNSYNNNDDNYYDNY